MPNWCFNQLTVCGGKNDITAFVAENRGTNDTESLSFNARVPRTPENGVDWGCKWDACNTSFFIHSDGETVEYSFRTPWTPPEAWLFTISAMYPDLEFTLHFDEEFRAFRGETVVRNGVKENYDFTPKE